MIAERYPEGCVEWPGGREKDGYGVLKWNGWHRAHRVIYEMFVGPIPKGMHVLHSCDNRACVNPRHLRVGTHAENMADRAQRGRTSRAPRASSCKVTAEQVEEIRASTLPVKDLQARYGLGKSQIYDIKNFRSWKGRAK